MREEELTVLEQRGWRALASDPATAEAFYRQVLDDAVVMVLPGGMVLDEREAILQSMAGAPWTSFELSDWRVMHPTQDTAVITYRADARRAANDPYSALISSFYVRRRDGWKLAFHQQTPR
ncbi:nuclear transport factor 2 family protein [Actinoplanes sp. NPDC026619]|uniref:nuclear transport factor 2 family protein n=1 Tax=Actinoplanes sp. NPDC026619 TaxID=3155798 RepID=UPI0033DE184D